MSVWPQQSGTKHVPAQIASFATATSIMEHATFAWDAVVVVVYWLLLWPDWSKNVPGGVQGFDLFFPVMSHAVLPGLFFIEYLTSRLPIDSSGRYWYVFGAVITAYAVVNFAATTLYGKPVYDILPWFTKKIDRTYKIAFFFIIFDQKFEPELFVEIV